MKLTDEQLIRIRAVADINPELCEKFEPFAQLAELAAVHPEPGRETCGIWFSPSVGPIVIERPPVAREMLGRLLDEMKARGPQPGTVAEALLDAVGVKS